jgi:hypothetical protein
VQRWKPRREVVDATHEASTPDYEKLAQAVLVAIINRQKDVILRFPYFVVFDDETYPKGIIVKKDEKYNYYKAKAFKLADWLYSKGFLPADAKGIMKSMRELAYLEGRIDKMLASDIENMVECRFLVEGGVDD